MNSKAEDDRLILAYREAYNFLADQVGEELLKRQLDHYNTCQPDSLDRVFYHLLSSLKNKQGYMNYIAPTEAIKDLVCDFDHHETYSLYGTDWHKLAEEFELRFGHKYKIDLKHNRNAWVMYTRGVLSGAKFLSNFKTFAEFDRFVRSFFLNEFTIASLPMLLEKEIFGFGFPLACDFLKEIGYGQYGKPDVHLKDIMGELGLSEVTDYEVFKTIVKTALLVGENPVTVDKVYWLIGSGNFNDEGIKIPRGKDSFINHMKVVLDQIVQVPLLVE
jgi:hypothetical protein